MNSMATTSSSGTSTLQETAASNETVGSEPCATGTKKKNTNVNTKSRTNYDGKRYSNWAPPHRRNYKSRNFMDPGNRPYNNSERYNQTASMHHSTRQSDYFQNTNDFKYHNQDSREESDAYYRDSSHNSQYRFRNRKIRNGPERNQRYDKNDSYEKKIVSSKSNEENDYKNLGHDREDTRNDFRPNMNGNYKNRNFKHHDEKTYEELAGDKFSKGVHLKNGRPRNSEVYDIDPNPKGYFNEMRYKGEGYRRNYGNGYTDSKKPRKEHKKKFEIASQRERLEEMIKQRTLECLVCCELLKPHNEVWSCKQCYNILHLKCTQAWAKSSKVENGWRCPACQNVCKDIPSEYLCFCGKLKNPKNIPGLIAHSCGEVCLKDGRNCEHRCSILCHPGPCPDCTILVDKSCGCGKTKQQVMCSSELEITCSNLCGKLLRCNIHECTAQCHTGDCDPCAEILHQTCFCEKEGRDVTCSPDFEGSTKYSCKAICDKTLSCGNHKCLEICHSGACKPCSKDCDVIKTCFCGKKPLEVPRTSCLDPIPSCGWLCQKTLKCGPNMERHKCEYPCHDGDCPPCRLTTVLRCRCGSMNKEVPCSKLVDDDVKCERKCTKKRLCGKHKCNQRCCIEVEHICPLPCNKTLSCGNHRCEMTCHSGRCRPCVETSFEELYCECGAEVMYPPIPCGTRPPICNRPCSRRRECGHEANHACHTGPCPPCTVLCKRWCYGNHEQRGAIPCHQEDFSCGLPCAKPMPCGRHKCNSPCHLGPCPVPCKQPCTVERSSCGHPCLAACHDPPCPQTTCRGKVSVSCICGLQKGVRSCNDVINEIRNLELAQLSEKMMNMLKNQSVDISDMSKPKRPDILKILECTEECRVMERNRRLAIGLQIRNPDISQKLTPRYSDFMRGWAKKDPHFCQRIHDKLTELVQLAKQSQQKSRAHSFESMNRDKRQFVHEYCEHFGCESEAYDAEPNRNVVATAIRDKSWLPSMSLLEVIQRENGQRKVPMPSHLERNLCSKSESVTLKPLNRTLRLGVPTSDFEYSKK